MSHRCGHPATCGRIHSRRDLLIGGGVLGLGAIAASSALGQAAARPHRIDVHHHIFPPQFLQEAPKGADQFRNNPNISGWSRARALEGMDLNGIDISVLSFPQPSFWSPEVEAQRRLARLTNDFFAGVIQEHPSRFGLFAGLPPLQDTEGCLQEIDYAFGALKANGVRVMTSYQDRWLGDKSFAPVMDELNRRKAVVFVHPDVATCCKNLLPGIGVNYIEYPIDTARAATNLWFNGAFDLWPDIRFILSHGGGALPMLADRASQLGRPDPRGGDAPLRDGMEQFRRIYVDTANAANPPALAAAAALVPEGHILFGTDDPFVPIPRQIENLRKAPFSAAQLRGIERDNALALLPALRR